MESQQKHAAQHNRRFEPRSPFGIYRHDYEYIVPTLKTFSASTFFTNFLTPLTYEQLDAREGVLGASYCPDLLDLLFGLSPTLASLKLKWTYMRAPLIIIPGYSFFPFASRTFGGWDCPPLTSLQRKKLSDKPFSAYLSHKPSTFSIHNYLVACPFLLRYSPLIPRLPFFAPPQLVNSSVGLPEPLTRHLLHLLFGYGGSFLHDFSQECWFVTFGYICDVFG